MDTLPNNVNVGVVFKAAKRFAVNGILSGVMALMYCQAALALDINQANEAELDSVKGMGPALSAKVLKARAESPFYSWADFMQRVSGIRQSKAQKFSEQGLTVNGQAFNTKP